MAVAWSRSISSSPHRRLPCVGLFFLARPLSRPNSPTTIIARWLGITHTYCTFRLSPIEVGVEEVIRQVTGTPRCHPSQVMARWHRYSESRAFFHSSGPERMGAGHGSSRVRSMRNRKGRSECGLLAQDARGLSLLDWEIPGVCAEQVAGGSEHRGCERVSDDVQNENGRIVTQILLCPKFTSPLSATH